MKAFVKTVSLTLCISVTMLFFSSYKKVEAAATGTLIASTVAVAIGAIVSYICAAAADYINSSLDSLSSDIIADLKWDKMEKDRIAAEAAQRVKDYMSSTEYRQKIMEQLQPTETVSEYPVSQFIEAQAYFSSISSPDAADKLGYAALLALQNSTQTITVDTVNDRATLNKPVTSDIVSAAYNSLISSSGSGAAAGITSGISVINGKPQKVTTTYAESTVEVFDYLGLDYQMFNSLEDVFVDCSVTRTYKYYRPFIITTDNKLYTFENEIQFSYKIGSYSSAYLQFYGVRDRFAVSTNGENDTYRAFRFYIKDGILCVAFYLSQVDTSNRLTRKQFIVSNPSLSNYPVLFSDKLSYKTIDSTNFENYAANFNLYCVPDKTSIEANEIMSLDIACVGCFKGKPQAPTPDINSSTLQTASNMLAGTESIVQGGTNTTYSELSDIEKAIYALAKQQGITYEEMLEQSNLVVENGQIYLEGLDGVTHSIESLLSEFDKLLEQGDITNENIAASTEQLKAILEYLKGLNIEGLGSYIQQLETTLDGLKQGDEDREAILGDISDQLRGLNDYLDSLGLSAAAGDISQIKESNKAVADTMTAILNHEKDVKEKEQKAALAIASLLSPTVGNYNLYDQCKYLLEKLFNYDDINIPPDFAFFWDSNGDGIPERYDPFNLSFLEITLTNETFADKTWFFNEIKIIDFIRYLIALVIYSFFVMRLLKRLPTFYGLGPLSRFGG